MAATLTRYKRKAKRMNAAEVVGLAVNLVNMLSPNETHTKPVSDAIDTLVSSYACRAAESGDRNEYTARLLSRIGMQVAYTRPEIAEIIYARANWWVAL